MLIAIVILASILMIVWLLLLGMVNNEDWVAAATNKVLDNWSEIDKLRLKDAERASSLKEYRGVAGKVMSVFLGGSSDKNISKIEKQNTELQRGNFRGVSILPMPGYVMQRRIPSITNGSIYRTVMEKSIELYGKKYASNKAKQLVAQILSYPIIGLSFTLSLGAILLGTGNQMPGFGVLLGGSLLVIVLVYALYDELSDRVNKRRTAITRQFPNVVSKLALLVTSGMIMDRAWRETAESQEAELYIEMRRTSDELANLVEPSVAYMNFIDRCNTKETTKLASAIIQSLSKGNAEIGALLKGMAHEAWQERRHMAKRDSEAANSKLMIPTMLLFLAILVIIMVPVVINFSNLM